MGASPAAAARNAVLEARLGSAGFRKSRVYRGKSATPRTAAASSTSRCSSARSRYTEWVAHGPGSSRPLLVLRLGAPDRRRAQARADLRRADPAPARARRGVEGARQDLRRSLPHRAPAQEKSERLRSDKVMALPDRSEIRELARKLFELDEPDRAHGPSIECRSRPSRGCRKC